MVGSYHRIGNIESIDWHGHNGHVSLPYENLVIVDPAEGRLWRWPVTLWPFW